MLTLSMTQHDALCFHWCVVEHTHLHRVTPHSVRHLSLSHTLVALLLVSPL